MATINNTFPNQATLLARAAAVTDELVDYANTIRKRNFRDNPDPEILAAIITALASVYVAEANLSK